MDNDTLMRRISAFADSRSKPQIEEIVPTAADAERETLGRSQRRSKRARSHEPEPGHALDDTDWSNFVPAAPSVETPSADEDGESSAASVPVVPLMTFDQEAALSELERPDPSRLTLDERPYASLISCDGTRAIVEGSTDCVDTVTGRTWTVGRMLSIVVGENRVVGMVCDVAMPEQGTRSEDFPPVRFSLELIGEVRDTTDGDLIFIKGITSYPGIGAMVHQIRSADLAAVYAATGSRTAFIGQLSQDESIPAYVDVADMLAKHFAVLGSTGSGKSATVSLLLHAAHQLVPDLRTVVLDPHNEYSRAFPEANTITQATIDLPFWMLQLEEYVEVLFRGKPVVHEEVDVLRECIPLAKAKFSETDDLIRRRSSAGASLTSDSPVPYRMNDLLGLIKHEMGLLDSRFDKSVLKSLKARILAHCNDPRYAFMFRHRTIEDIAQSVVANFFGLNSQHRGITIIQMAGMPSEVVNAIASVLSRLAFELAMAAKGRLKILMICEEAHRYVPVGKDGFEPTRRAISRIAKEGRKYGAFMAIVSQRPSELDPTILSQCSTVFALRLTNDYDQEIIRRAISSSSASTVSFISSLSNREAIAFGEGISTPMRMQFRKLPSAWLPGADADVFKEDDGGFDTSGFGDVFKDWRRSAV